ncbi:MAG: apolipoprotein N-acyltransferase [Candidatus Binatia bacterium]
MTAGWKRFGGALAGGLLLAAAFPRLGQNYVAWMAMVPLLVAVRGIAPRKAAGYGWITGFVFFLVTISWVPDTISNFTAISPLLAKAILVLMAAACAYSYALFAFALEALAARGVSRLLAAPVLWVVLEWMRCFVVAEFPWNLLGYSQLPYLALVQAADLGGIYLISAAIVLCNAALADALAAARGHNHADRSAAARVLLAVMCPVVLLSYGTWRLSGLRDVPYTGSLRVAITQGNIPQNAKWDAAWADHIFATYVRLTEQAAAAGAQLVVWPEAALPFYIQRDMRSIELQRIARERGIDLLVGAPGLEDRDGTGAKDYNQAWLLRADGDVQGPYDKMQLVPFGEYIPLYGLFGLVSIAVESVGQLGRGDEYTIFETMEMEPVQAAGGDAPRRARFATLICYEGIFPGLTRRFAAAGADFLVNISNDAWYGDTSAADQHLYMAAVRSIENRLPMVRSTNTGISAFVTDEGRVGNTTPLFHEDLVIETVLMRDVWSFYRIYGDVFLHLCQGLLVLMVLAALRGRAAAARAEWGDRCLWSRAGRVARVDSAPIP